MQETQFCRIPSCITEKFHQITLILREDLN